jgi:hypothetical protein
MTASIGVRPRPSWSFVIPYCEHLALFRAIPLHGPVPVPGDLNTTIWGSDSETERPDQSFRPPFGKFQKVLPTIFRKAGSRN